MPDAPISIVIPTRDGAATLPGVLDAIERQEVDFEFEVVAVDSGSEDATTGILRDRVDRLIEIPPDRFDHGLTRNLGIEAARGKLVVLLVQDAEPARTDWLRCLVRPLAGDDRVAGAFARQVPRPGASRMARRALSRWVAGQGVPRRIALDGEGLGEGLDALAPLDRLHACAFDNVCSCIRRSAWERLPFPKATFAEDLEWARSVLQAGWALVYEPAAVVLHSHDRSVSSEFQRTVTSHRRLRELFGVRTIPSARHLGRSLAVTLADHVDCLAREPGPRPGASEIARALALAVAWPLGQYVGGRE